MVTKTKLLSISERPLQKGGGHQLLLHRVATKPKYLLIFFFQEPSDSSEQLAEEEVARLSGELQWLREETRHGDRKLEELQDQVILTPGDILGYDLRLEACELVTYL